MKTNAMNAVMTANDASIPTREDRMNESQKAIRIFEKLEGAEDVTRRGEATKHYNLGNGRCQAMTFSEPIHYKVSGAPTVSPWQDIDNNLVPVLEKDGRTWLQNKANDVKISLAAETG